MLATGHPDAEPKQAFLAAINMADGSDAWLQELRANVVKGGTAVDHAGRIFITLEDGSLHCFAAVKR